MREKHHLGCSSPFFSEHQCPLSVDLDDLTVLNLECADILRSIAFDFIDSLISDQVTVLSKVDCSVYAFVILDSCKTISDSFSVCANLSDDREEDVCSIVAVCSEGVWADAPLCCVCIPEFLYE